MKHFLQQAMCRQTRRADFFEWGEIRPLDSHPHGSFLQRLSSRGTEYGPFEGFVFAFANRVWYRRVSSYAVSLKDEQKNLREGMGST